MTKFKLDDVFELALAAAAAAAAAAVNAAIVFFGPLELLDVVAELDADCFCCETDVGSILISFESFNFELEMLPDDKDG